MKIANLMMIAVFCVINYFFYEKIFMGYTKDPAILAEGMKFKNIL